VHGKKAGPVLLISSGMGQNEVNGIAIIERLLSLNLLKGLNGTLIAIPALNIYSLFMHSKYLPDQSDLEGAFPGSETGSFASRIAFLLSKQIFQVATHCIDIHSGANHIENLSQVRTHLESASARAMAQAFQPPVIYNVEPKEGMLHLLRRENPIPTIIYDTGEPDRLDEEGAREGVKGVIRVMRELKMLGSLQKEAQYAPRIVRSSLDIRSPGSGLFRFLKPLGAEVKKGNLVARISDPFGKKTREEILSPIDGILVSRSVAPLVHEGELIFTVAETEFVPIEKPIETS
jgi:predicted deacylase